MSLKATLQPDHVNVNKFTFTVIGLVPLVFTMVSGMEEAIDAVTLPDRTMASGGNSKPVEFTGKTPMHHTLEYLALEAWFEEGKVVTITYKKAATLEIFSGSEATKRRYSLLGVWITKRKLPDLEMSDEGAMAEAEWTFSADSVVPI